MNLGDQITTEFIRKTKCPVHGEFCHSIGRPHFCRARIDKAVMLWHRNRILRREHGKVFLG